MSDIHCLLAAIHWICGCIHANNGPWSHRISWLLLLAPTTQCHSKIFGTIFEFFWMGRLLGHRVGFKLGCIYFWLYSSHTSQHFNPEHIFIKCRTSWFRQVLFEYCFSRTKERIRKSIPFLFWKAVTIPTPPITNTEQVYEFL